MKKKWAMVKIIGEAKRTKSKISSTGPKIAAETCVVISKSFQKKVADKKPQAFATSLAKSSTSAPSHRDHPLRLFISYTSNSNAANTIYNGKKLFEL